MNAASRPVLFATLLLACRDPDQGRGMVSTTTVTNAELGAAAENDRAVLSIVEARCAREVSCNKIGEGQPFTTKDACLREMRSHLEAELQPARCPSGLDENSLGNCLDAIRNETCGSPMETMARAAACRTAKMCLSAREP